MCGLSDKKCLSVRLIRILQGWSGDSTSQNSADGTFVALETLLFPGHTKRVRTTESKMHTLVATLILFWCQRMRLSDLLNN